MKELLLIILWFITVNMNSQIVVNLVLPDNCNAPTVIEDQPFQKDKATLKIYPNPNNGSFYIYVELLSAIKKVKINISDSKGNVIHSEIVYCNSKIMIKQMNITKIPAGTYVLELISDKLILSEKFLISK